LSTPHVPADPSAAGAQPRSSAVPGGARRARISPPASARALAAVPWVAYHAIERPGIRLGQHLARRRTRRPAAADVDQAGLELISDLDRAGTAPAP